MNKVPFLSPNQIEGIVEVRLITAGMAPTSEHRILDLEAFIQGPLNAVFDEYADLPADIMGEVEFEPGIKDHVKINRDLSELADSSATETAATAQARRRSTAAHEIGHIILHRSILMPVLGQTSLQLFDAEDPAPPRSTVYRCLKADFGNIKNATAHRPLMRTQGVLVPKEIDYMEIQANIAMAALLLPRSIFCSVAQKPLRQCVEQRGQTEEREHFDQWRRMIRNFAEQFQVSRQVVDIRLKTLNLMAHSQNETLF
ncbi:MAG: ImmA/IrrE family metallo-endopeptidase [Armatimonadetes bacterium]|nr:ImmA/IrrE family metallo-endopeptidase [Armatimonadota bacterium]